MKLKKQGACVILCAVIGIAVLSLGGCGKGASNNTDEVLESIRKTRDLGVGSDYREAIITLKALLQKESKNADARLLLGELYVKLGDTLSAEKELLLAAKYGAPYSDLVLPLSRVRLTLGRYSEILTDVLGANDLRPRQHAELLLLRARAYLATGQVDSAKREVATALELVPTLVVATVLQAQIAREEGQLDESRRLAGAVLARNPESIEAKTLLGDLDFDQGNYQGAARYFSEITKKEPENLRYRAGLAEARMKSGDVKGAARVLDEILKVSPEDAMVLYMRAKAAFLDGQLDKASEYADDALAYAENRAVRTPSLLLAGVVNYRLNRLQIASVHLRRYLALVPDADGARALLAGVELLLDSPGKAATALKLGDMDSERQGELYEGVALAALRGGDLATASALFRMGFDKGLASARARAAYGVTELKLNNRGQAQKELKHALDKNPGLSDARVILAMTYLQRGNYDRALEEAEKLQRIDPEKASGYSLAGMVYAVQGHEQDARDQFTKAFAVQPGDVNAGTNLAAYALRDGQTAEARRILGRVLDFHPGNLEASQQLIEIELAGDKLEAAAEVLEGLLLQNPDAIDDRLRLVRTYLKLGRRDDAGRAAAAGLQRGIYRPKLIAALGNIQLSAGQYSEALTSFKRLTEREPDSASAHYYLALAQERLGQDDDAEESLRRSLELNPGDVNALLLKVRIAIRLRHLDGARADLDALEAQGVQTPDIDELNGLLALAAGDSGAAVSHLRSAYKRRSNNFNAIRLANALWESGQWREGRLILEDWLDKHPDSFRVREILADRLMLRQDFKAALGHYEYLRQREQGGALMLNNMAWSLLQAGRLDRASEVIEAARREAPGHPTILDTYASILMGQGRYMEADQALVKAAEAAPDDPQYRFRRVEALVHAGKLTEARKVLQELEAVGSEYKEQWQKANRLLEKTGAL